MKSREPVITRGRDDWDQVNLPPQLFRDRIEGIRADMERAGLDALLVYGRGDRDGHLCYVSNLVNKVPDWGLLAIVTPQTVVLRNERSSRTRPVIERGTWIEEVEFVDDVVANLEPFVASGDGLARLGTAGFESMPYPQWARFEERAEPAEVVPADDLLRGRRRVKSRRERDEIERAARILREVYAALGGGSSVPVLETTLEARADRLARLRGAQDFRFLVSHPSRTEADFRPAERQPVEGDEPLGVYTACRYEGYWAACARTVRLDGERPYPGVAAEAEEAYADFVSSLQAGASAAEVVGHLRQRLEASNVSLAQAYSLGGGIGLEVDEPPALGNGDTAELQADETLAVQLVLEPERDALLCFGDTVHVSDDGPRTLTGGAGG